MHDRRRGTKHEPTAEEQAALDETIVAFKKLYADCFANRNANRIDRDVFASQEQLLPQNPECYSIWAYRRRVYEALWDEEARKVHAVAPAEAAEGEAPVAPQGPSAAELKTQSLLQELKFNTNIITSDYKCYAAWVHRRWILNHLDTATRLKVLMAENTKLEQLLRADERNFHAWGYRRWVITTLDVEYAAYPSTRDLEFTETKINQNFGNYSAWHQRILTSTKLVQSVEAREAGADANAVRALLLQNVVLLVRAFYCDPGDQSAWIVAPALVALLRRLATFDGATYTADLTEALTQMRTAAYELAEDDLAEDRTLKWPLWLIANVVTSESDSQPVDVRAKQLKLASRRDIWVALQSIDPLRNGYYAELIRRHDAAQSS